jgi:hypothetical protein
MPCEGLLEIRRGIPDEHNDNIPLVYTLEITLNLNDFNPDYPQSPRNLGERIRKARMDRGLLIRELASELGVTDDTVINWEVRHRQPQGKSMERVRGFIEAER